MTLKIKKVTLEYDDFIYQIEGEEAEKWDRYNTKLAVFAKIHGMNPFDRDPIKWKELVKEIPNE